MAGTSVGAVYVDAILNNKGFNKQVESTVSGAGKTFSSAFGKIGGIVAAAFSVAAVTSFGKAAVQSAIQAESAFMGLNSILTANGRSFAEAKGFLDEYVSDGLVPMTNAANAYKLMASRGFSTKQIEDMMLATKDMAAFNRQAHYDMGEAVEVFAQGLKNEESTLTDAAGMTKNLSIIWDEYAQTIGKTGATLTQTEKVQAEYAAVMNEWRYSMGDAATVADSFQGRLQRLQGTFSSIKTEFGNVVIPILDLFMPALQAAANAILNFIVRLKQLLSIFGLKMKEIGGGGSNGAAGAFDATASSANAAADAIKGTGGAASSAAKAIKRALMPYDELNKLQSQAASGGGGGGGGSGGSTDSTIPDADVEVVKEGENAFAALGATAQKFLAPLKEISFDNLVKAFGELKDSIAGLGRTVWAGLEWAYFNLLVPLAEWTIEDALPAFFHLLAGAFRAVDGILQEVYPILIALLENFLQPIAAWTGGVIVDTLNKMGDALYWVGDNANLVVGASAGLAAAFGTLKGLTIAASVLDFIKYAGALAGTSTAWGSIAAAFGQLFTYFQAGKIWTAITGVFTGLSGAAGGLAAALGISVGALAGIVAAVAGVVAAGYLLITNWDEVVAWFKALPDKLAAVWNRIKNWFVNLPDTIRGYFDRVVQKIESIDWYAIGYKLATKIGEGIANIVQFVSNAWESVKTWFGGLPSRLDSAWKNAKTWFSNLPQNMWKTIQGAFDWFSNIDKWFKEIGEACVDGIVKGWEAIKEAVTDFVKGFVDGVKAALGIKSPSTVFATIGGYCIDGLRNGLIAGKSKITGAWNTVKGWFSAVKQTVTVSIPQKWKDKDVSGKWKDLTENIRDKTANMRAKVASKWSDLRGAWSSITNNIKDKTASMKAKIGTTWSSLKSKWNSLMSNFKNKTVTVSIKLSSVVSDLKGWINSNFIKKVNSALPSFMKKIPYLAQGGWLPANSPQLAVVGDNRREGEIVAPESKIREQVKAAIAEMGGGGYGTIRLEIAMPNGRTIIKEINRAQMAAGKVLLLT